MALPVHSLKDYLDRKCTVYISHASGAACVRGKNLFLINEASKEERKIELDSRCHSFEASQAYRQWLSRRRRK